MSTGYVCSIKTDWSSGSLRFVETVAGNAVITVSTSGLTFGEGENIAFGTTTGSQIGTSATQKLGFYGKTPVVQRAKASYANWAALSNVVQALVDLGLFDAP